MKDIEIGIKDIVEQFVDALLEPDFIMLEKLLTDTGKFDIQDSELETLEVGKSEFLEWIWVQRMYSTVHKVDYDQCLHCSIGAPVVLFNNGLFPRLVKDFSERSKTGLMLDTKDGLIHSIKFCYVFVKTENKCMFELKQMGKDYGY